MQNGEFPVQRLAHGTIDYALYHAAAARLRQQVTRLPPCLRPHPELPEETSHD
jgi:hypothetical protein